MNGRAVLRDVVVVVDRILESGRLDVLDPFHREGRHPGNFAFPRKYEIAAAINRLRTVKMVQGKGK